MNARTHDRADGFRTADAPEVSLLEACVRCGACIQSCPTYQEIGIEPDDPRGRVFLITAAHDGQLAIDERFSEHIYNCLDCRACETACPMDVQVGRLIEEARGEIRHAHPTVGWRRWGSDAILRGIFPHPRRFEGLVHAFGLLRRSGLMRLARWLRLTRLVPEHLDRIERHTPTPPLRSARRRLRRGLPAVGTQRGTAALLHGCVMNTLFADVTVATAEVLQANGWSVEVPRGQTCCGALHVHDGDRDTAKALARRNIEAFERSGADAYVVNAAGCGSACKEYGVLLRNDPDWAERATAFAARVRDVNELLVEHGWRAPRGTFPARAVYQDACHLAHAQGIRSQPRDLLRSVPGLIIDEMPDPERCCGSAGIHNLTHPEVSTSLMERKVADVPHGVDTLITANPGCHLHLLRGLREAGRPVRVVHVMDVLAHAYRAEAGAPS